VTPQGQLYEVNVDASPLRLRREPRIDRTKPSANVIAHLPDGHRVRWLSGKPTDAFLEVETSLNGAHLRGFASSKYLVKVAAVGDIPVVVPRAAPPTTGVIAVSAPRKASLVTRRTQIANALSLNEPNRPARAGTTPQELRTSLWRIVDYLAVDKASHARYQPRDGMTFCNIYAHDYCALAGVYLPRVWWSQEALERLTRGETVEPRIGATILEQRANVHRALFRILGSNRELEDLLQDAFIEIYRALPSFRGDSTLEGKSGHVTLVVPKGVNPGAARCVGRSHRCRCGSWAGPWPERALARVQPTGGTANSLRRVPSGCTSECAAQSLSAPHM
jgi:hypothetical protein